MSTAQETASAILASIEDFSNKLMDAKQEITHLRRQNEMLKRKLERLTRHLAALRGRHEREAAEIQRDNQ